MVRYYNELTRLEMEQVDKDETVVMIPVGALEQHGNQCPLGTDEIIAEGTARRIDHSAVRLTPEELEKYAGAKGWVDVFVFNDTKVFPARLYGNKEKTGAEIEVFLLRELNRDLRIWDVLVDPARKIRIGNKLYFGEDDSLVAEVIDNTTSRGRTLRFLFDGEYDEFKKLLYGLGETPLPRTITRKVEPEDEERYQTIFARYEGAVAAPTAGLHFSRELMKRMEIKGIDFAYIK